MQKFIIQGGQELKGEIPVKGGKNSALKIIPASILSNEIIKISNLPQIEDIDKSLELVKDLGAKINKQKKYIEINPKNINKTTLSATWANKFRASIMFIGPLLARFGEVKFPHPGGCVIGAGGRPIDLFLEGFKALGAKVKIDGNDYHIQAKKLKGAEYFFSQISVTATESLMMTATLAEGITTLKNCAMEPEIKNLANYLNSNGAQIEGAGTPTIKIKGVKKISGGEISIMPDRLETGSFALMAATTKSEIDIINCDPSTIEVLLNIFNKIGIPFKRGEDFLSIKKSKKIISHDIKTHEYPGFPTDLQPPYAVLMTQAEGQALIHETIYDRRLQYIDMLSQMGAKVSSCDPHRAFISGPTKLYGKKLTSPDLRAGIAMLIAGLAAEGETTIDNIYQIDRGYENIDERLRKLGANIRRI